MFRRAPVFSNSPNILPKTTPKSGFLDLFIGEQNLVGDHYYDYHDTGYGEVSSLKHLLFGKFCVL